MQKIIINCPHCKKKMKINNKMATYKCPHCNNLYKYNIIQKIYMTIISFFKDFYSTLIDIKKNIKNKFINAKNTYKYLKQVKANIKRDSNWSQYHKESKEKNKKFKFKNFFKKNK